MTVPPPVLPDPVVTIPSDRIKTPSRILATIAIISTILAVYGFFTQSRQQFGFSFLVSFVYLGSILLGSLFWVLVHHVTNAHWSTVLRRLWENNTRALWILGVCGIVMIPCMKDVYKWANAGAWVSTPIQTESSTTPSEHPASDRTQEYVVSMHGVHHIAHDRVLQKQVWPMTSLGLQNDWPWFHPVFFYLRFILYLAIWIFIATTMANWSAAQDTTGDSSYSWKMSKRSTYGLILLALSSTFFNFDWNMSTDHHWYSTIFGVYYWAGSINCAMASMILVVLFLHGIGRLRNTITIEQMHDMGKIMFGFTIFWTYIGFAQYFLYWYANLPEETLWFQHRRVGMWYDGNWNTASWCLFIGRFIIPFFWLIRRRMKRIKLALGIAAVWIMGIHYLDLYWQIMPNYMNEFDHPTHTTGIHTTWLDAACWWMLISWTALFVINQWPKRPLIPVGDPRLGESLTHKNYW